MNIQLEKILNNSFVISINDVKLNNFYDHFQNNGFNIMPKKINGIVMKSEKTNYSFNNIYDLPSLNQKILGISLSHLFIIKMANFLDYPFVCIFEEDCIPVKNSLDKMKYYLNDIPNDCQILKFGNIGITNRQNIVDDNLINNKFYKNLYTYGTHAYVIFKNFYDSYEKLFSTNIVCDHEVFNTGNMILHTNETIFIQDRPDSTIEKLNNAI